MYTNPILSELVYSYSVAICSWFQVCVHLKLEFSNQIYDGYFETSNYSSYSWKDT